ncbi:MAG TPA: hypothetical protein VNO26_01720, partial [Candidatus Limnocylindria bacterium]|nr:hypothetical protein [Candidatus Limnocylindria bacterium]
AEAAAAAAEKAAETEALAARLAAAEAARAAAEQSATSWAQRHDALAAEFEAAVARAEDLARALEAIRADTASDRVAAEGARAAAQVDAEATRALLAEAQQRVDALTQEVSMLRETVATLEHEAEARTAELAAALAAQTERAIEALEPAPPPRPAPPPPATTVRPVTPVTTPANVSADVRRIAVVDDPSGWANVKLHGVETIVMPPADDLAAKLAEAATDRVLVNLAARGAFDALIAARAAGASVPFCGCLIPPGITRGLGLGFVEVVHAPLDPDEVIGILTPYASRGTRVLTAGADADAFISLRQALARQGMSVSMAWDGKQASDLLQMVRPEIVVVDMDIPPRSGLGLIIELSAAPVMPMLVLLPGRQDLAKRTAAELSDPGLGGRLLPPDRLLEEVRRSGKPK